MFQLNKPDFISTNTAGNVLSEMSRCCHHVNSCRNTHVSLKYSAVSQQTGYKDIRVSSAGGAESRAGLCSLTRIVWCDNEHKPLMFIYYLSQLEQNLQLRKYTLCALCETFTCCCVVLCWLDCFSQTNRCSLKVSVCLHNSSSPFCLHLTSLCLHENSHQRPLVSYFSARWLPHRRAGGIHSTAAEALLSCVLSFGFTECM